jgi:iron(III) transport system permease protein
MGVAILVAALLWLTGVPVAMLIWGSLRDAPAGVAGGYTLANYALAYGQPAIYQAAANSVVFAGGSSLLAFGIGAFLAVVVERTGAPWKPLVYTLAILPVILPGIVMTISWSLVLAPTIGLLNKAASGMFALHGPLVNGHSMAAMIWVNGVDHVSLPFLLMAAALRGIDHSHEEAALASGCSPLRTLTSVTLPLLRPAMVATLLLLFLRGLETFEVPAVLGIPAGIPVFATSLWLAIRKSPADLNLAAAYGMGYLALTLAGLWLYSKSTALADRFSTISGKGFRQQTFDVGGARWLLGVVALLLLAIVLLPPFCALLWTSLIPYYTVPSLTALQRVSFDNYSWILAFDVLLRAVRNSILAGLLSSFGAALLAVIVSWLVVRTRSRGRGLLDGLAFSPMAVPGTLFGLALIWLYLALPLPVYGTLAVIVLGFTAAFLPLAVRITQAGLVQIHRAFEEAAAVSGASWLPSMARIVLPLLLPSLLVAVVYIFSLSLKVLALPVMLSRPGSELLSMVVFDLYGNGDYPRVAALSVLMISVLVILSIASRALTRRLGLRQPDVT